MLIKILWKARREGMARFRGLVFRSLRGSYFRSVGTRAKFYNWPRFGSCNGNIDVGTEAWVGNDVFFSAGPECEIRIGNRCSINTGGHLVALYGISIGDGTRIGEYTSIRDQNHGTTEADRSVDGQPYSGSEIKIGKNCWIGRGVFIGPGVTIGDGAVVGANAVVIRDVPAGEVHAGVPAKQVGAR